MDTGTVLMLSGLAVNLLAVLGFFNRMESRLTRVETVLNIFMSRQHVTPRRSDRFDVEDE
jgi:hypothetical protein